jgi:molybdopterin-containing oxidoreductase family membrane subunit
MGLNKTVGYLGYHKLCLWVGIGHAEHILLYIIIPSRWRMAINRSAEAMTFFPVFRGLFPIIHMGRPWLAFCITNSESI